MKIVKLAITLTITITWKIKDQEFKELKIFFNNFKQSRIPIWFAHLACKKLRTNDEAKKAGMPRILDDIDGKIKIWFQIS